MGIGILMICMVFCYEVVIDCKGDSQDGRRCPQGVEHHMVLAKTRISVSSSGDTPAFLLLYCTWWSLSRIHQPPLSFNVAAVVTCGCLFAFACCPCTVMFSKPAIHKTSRHRCFHLGETFVSSSEAFAAGFSRHDYVIADVSNSFVSELSL